MIVVCAWAELYDTKSFKYRNKALKEEDWSTICEMLQLASSNCRWETCTSQKKKTKPHPACPVCTPGAKYAFKN